MHTCGGSAAGEVLTTTECIACRHRLCSVFPPRDRSHHQTFRSLKRGDCLDAGSDETSRLWIVISGAVAMSATLPDGRRQILHIDMPGDLVCSMLTQDRDACVLEALDAVELCEIDLDSGSATAEATFALFEQARGRLTRSARQIICLGRLDATERLCSFLADMARRTGPGEENLRVSLPMTREDIADYLGLNAETVSRVFSRIRKSRLAIFLSPTEYVVPSLHDLERRIPIGLRQTRVAQPAGPAATASATQSAQEGNAS